MLNLNNEYKQKVIDAFKTVKEFRQTISSCPPDELRVKDKTNCFYCNDCWLAVLEINNDY